MMREIAHSNMSNNLHPDRNSNPERYPDRFDSLCHRSFGWWILDPTLDPFGDLLADSSH